MQLFTSKKKTASSFTSQTGRGYRLLVCCVRPTGGTTLAEYIEGNILMPEAGLGHDDEDEGAARFVANFH